MGPCLLHLCQDLILTGKRTYLGGVQPNMPPWVGRGLNLYWGSLTSSAIPWCPHIYQGTPLYWEYGGVFGGPPPRYVRFDPPLKS